MAGAIGKRLAEVEARLRLHRPRVEPDTPCAWLNFVSCTELDQLERLAYEWAFNGVEPSEADQLRALAIQAEALARMAANWPEWSAAPGRYEPGPQYRSVAP